MFLRFSLLHRIVMLCLQKPWRSFLQQALGISTMGNPDLVKLYFEQINKYNGYLRGVISACPEDILKQGQKT